MTWAVGLAACHGGGEACALAPRPTAAAVAGDANSDGRLDIADGAALLDATFRGGPQPACAAAADALGDGFVDAGDAISTWYHLFVGNTLIPDLPAGACAAPADPPPAACADGLALTIDAPASASGTFEARVRLTSPEPVGALSLGVRAAGCAVRRVTTDGTVAADRRDQPPGARDGGFFRADLVADGAVAALVTTIQTDAVLPAGADQDVLVIEVEPAAGCARCELTISGDLRGPGEVVPVVAAIGGRSYAPAAGSASVSCGL